MFYVNFKNKLLNGCKFEVCKNGNYSAVFHVNCTIRGVQYDVECDSSANNSDGKVVFSTCCKVEKEDTTIVSVINGLEYQTIYDFKEKLNHYIDFNSLSSTELKTLSYLIKMLEEIKEFADRHVHEDFIELGCFFDRLNDTSDDDFILVLMSEEELSVQDVFELNPYRSFSVYEVGNLLGYVCFNVREDDIYIDMISSSIEALGYGRAMVDCLFRKFNVDTITGEAIRTAYKFWEALGAEYAEPLTEDDYEPASFSLTREQFYHQ